MKKDSMLRLIMLGIALFCTVNISAAEKPRRPNFVFILIDDLAFNELSCNGSTFYETPCIDALAQNSMKFEFGYSSSPMCSPARASILSGKSPARTGITQYIPGSQVRGFRLLCPVTVKQLPLEEVTIAETLREAGYDTAMMGKWHIGPVAQYGPQLQGFDKTLAVIETNRCAQFYPFNQRKPKKAGVKFKPYFPEAKEGDNFTDLLTDAAIDYIGEKRDKPFFLYLAHFAMHAPIASKESERKHFEEKAQKLPAVNDEGVDEQFSHRRQKRRQDDPEYAGELATLDKNIGRLTRAIKDLGIEKETVVIFVADNGGRVALNWHAHPTSVYPARGGKTFCFEGGIRVPYFIHWPGVTRAGDTCKTPVIGMDFYPTILEMAGLPLKPRQHKDGVSLVPLLEGKSIDRDAIYWHFPHYQGEGAYPAAAVREGKYKLVFQFDQDAALLFDIEADPNESKDLSKEKPELAARLKKKLDDHLAEVGAKLPEINSDRAPKREWTPGARSP